MTTRRFDRRLALWYKDAAFCREGEMGNRSRVLVAVVLAMGVSVPAMAQQPPSTSAGLTAELVKILNDRKLDAAAGRLGGPPR